MWVAEPLARIHVRAATMRRSDALTPSRRSDTYVVTDPNMVDGDSKCRPQPPSSCWWFQKNVHMADRRSGPNSTPVMWHTKMRPGSKKNGPP